MNTNNTLNNFMLRISNGDVNWNAADMKLFDELLIQQGCDPFFGWRNYIPHNTPHNVVMARINGTHESKGGDDGNYVNFDIWSKQTKNNGVLKIHKGLLNKVSVEDYNKQEKKFPFSIEWSGKNSKIKQPCYYPTHKENNNNNPLPLKNLLFPEIKGIRYKKIRFLDGDRLHWSSNNIQIMSRKEYNNHPNKNELTMLDEWVF